MQLMIAIICFFTFTTTVFAADKLHVSGSKIIYDTFAAEDEHLQEITWDDVEVFERLLRENKNISTLELNSSGGEISASIYMADLVIDYELETNVNGTCESACTTIFLGGNKRTVERGSWLGFHQSYWEADAIVDYYEINKSDKGWDTPFEFASWLYDDTQREILENLQYLVERGVEASFAIKTMKATSDEMWYPRRKELEAAGVIIE